MIAISFAEFLTRFLDAGGKPFWEEKPETVEAYNAAWRFE
jgi:hypothetical protein